jgi:5'-nucleotidase, C-terminal domain
MFEKDPLILAKSTSHTDRVLGSLKSAMICSFAHGIKMSSLKIRETQTSMGNFIASNIRDGLVADLFAIPSGSIRRNFEYPIDQIIFSYFDLIKELPFFDQITVIDVDGSTIEEMVEFSLANKLKTGGYMQLCSNFFDNQGIRSSSLDMQRRYRLCLTFPMLDGLDHNIPLCKFIEANQVSVNALKIGSIDSVSAVILSQARKLVAEQVTGNSRGGGRSTGIRGLGGLELFKELVGAEQPDWYVSRMFGLLDLDKDGLLGEEDLLVATVCQWFVESPVIETTVLFSKMAEFFGEIATRNALRDILNGAPIGRFKQIYRREVGAWFTRCLIRGGHEN